MSLTGRGTYSHDQLQQAVESISFYQMKLPLEQTHHGHLGQRQLLHVGEALNDVS
jgi:hypothetical protein